MKILVMALAYLVSLLPLGLFSVFGVPNLLDSGLSGWISGVIFLLALIIVTVALWKFLYSGFKLWSVK